MLCILMIKLYICSTENWVHSIRTVQKFTKDLPYIPPLHWICKFMTRIFNGISQFLFLGRVACSGNLFCIKICCKLHCLCFAQSFLWYYITKIIIISAIAEIVCNLLIARMLFRLLFFLTIIVAAVFCY